MYIFTPRFKMLLVILLVAFPFSTTAEGRFGVRNVDVAGSHAATARAETDLLNTAVVVGSAVTFTCYYDNAADVPDWLHCEPQNSTCTHVSQADLVQRKEFSHRFTLNIDRDYKRTELSIKAVERSDAGIYGCLKVVDGISTYHTVDLIVLETSPTCVVSPSDNGVYQIEEFNEFEVECNVNYAGNWSPTILCELPAERGHVTTSNIMLSGVPSTRRIQASRSMSNTSVNCTTNFDKDGQHFVNITRHRGVGSVRKHARNVPSYSVTWLSPAVAVLYGVQSVSISSPSKPDGQRRRTLSCTAAGNPSAEYKWTNAFDGSVTEGSEYVVDICDRHSVNRLVLQCHARNIVNGKEYSATADVTIEKTRVCRVSAISRRPSFFKSLGTYGGTVLSIWTTAAIVVIIMRRSAQKRHFSGVNLHIEEVKMISRGPIEEASVCTELLIKNPTTNHTTKAADFGGV